MKINNSISKFSRTLVLLLVVLISCFTLVSCVGDNSQYISSHSAQLADGANLRVMSSNVLTDKWGGDSVKSRVGTFVDMIEHYAPDVVGVQEYCSSWSNAVLDDSQIYKEIPIHDIDDSMTSIIYNTDKVDLISSGYQGFSSFDAWSMRYIAWGLFSTKSDGSKFVVTSTHWDFEGASGDITEGEKSAMRQIQASETGSFIKYLSDSFGVPVLATGDYNSIHEPDMEGYAEYKLLVEKLDGNIQNRGSVDCKFAVDDDNRLVLGVKNEEIYYDGFYRYDHIFYTGDVFPYSFNILDDGIKIQSDNPYSKMSDHASVYVDAKIN